LSSTNSPLVAKARNVASVQIISSVTVAALFLLQGPWDAVSALYGGLASMVTAWLLGRGVKRAEAAVLRDPKRSMQILYFGAAQRFLLVAVLLALGLAVLKLAPIAMCVGFVLTQLSFLMGTRSMARS